MVFPGFMDDHPEVYRCFPGVFALCETLVPNYSPLSIRRRTPGRADQWRQYVRRSADRCRWHSLIPCAYLAWLRCQGLECSTSLARLHDRESAEPALRLAGILPPCECDRETIGDESAE